MDQSRLGAHGGSEGEGLLLCEDFNPWKDRHLSASILYIGNLPADCSRTELLSYLSRFDSVVWMKINRDGKNLPGYHFAHAILKSVGGYERLLTYPSHAIRHMKLRVKMNGSSQVFSKYEERLNQRKVFVKRLSRTMNCEKLRQHFSRFGTVEDVDIPVNREDNSSRRIAFVTFSDEEAAEECAKVKKQKICGVEVICKRYKPPEFSSVKEETKGLLPTDLPLAEQAADGNLASGKLQADGRLERASEAPLQCLPAPVKNRREMNLLGSLGAGSDCLALMQTRYSSEPSMTGQRGPSEAERCLPAGFSMDTYSRFKQHAHPKILQSKDSRESGDPGLWCSQAVTRLPKQAQSRVDAPEAVRPANCLDPTPQRRSAVVFFKASGFMKVSLSPSD